MQLTARCLLALVVLCVPAMASADFYTQIAVPFSTTGLPVAPATTALDSHYDTGTLGVGELPNFATAYDNFTIINGGLITGMQWVGTYEETAAARTTTFRIGIYADNANAPGALVAPEFVVTAVETPTAVANFYHYATDLTPFAFTAASATKYWFAVAGQMDYGVNGFGLALSGIGDDRSFQDFQDPTTLVVDRNLDLVDYAIAITVVPEPSTCLLFAATVGTIGMRKWRKRRGQASKKV